MPQCPTCLSEVSEASRFCSSCGSPVPAPSEVADLTTGIAVAALPPARAGSSSSVDVGGFAPGAVLANRYRIVGLLGRGGMGEVYRADDLKLGQAVALKFLPKDLQGDPVRRERFFAEVRIARQVSHPNMCRVYDIGEFEGRHFLSMEYVDGEDLASLLKRIGHLPSQKALDIARQLCAGLAAAHDKGVLHRDLKPANIMLDGHGRVRITDFGLAVGIDYAREAGHISGTPAYMAPEQLAGEPASVRSDIYALGLVLYELCTGKRAFTAVTIAELRQQKERETPIAPSELSRDVDPIVERVIHRCIERDPRNRPGSVLQVVAALPGGDPLAAALAAGETPSPEMVAAASTGEGLQAPTAWALLAAAVILIVGSLLVRHQVSLARFVPMQKPPEAMIERAHSILQAAGYTKLPGDSGWGMGVDKSYLEHLRKQDASSRRWNSLGPDALFFWYRESPRTLVNENILETGITPSEPPMTYSGEVRVVLNAGGNLKELTAVPPQKVEGQAPASVRADWPALIREAGFDPASLVPADPQWTPDFHADATAAWVQPNGGSNAARIEAGSFRGMPVEFQVIRPWMKPSRMTEPQMSASAQVNDAFGLGFLTLLVVGGAVLARRNLRLGRGDRRGATRLAATVICLNVVSWLLSEKHVASSGELYLAIGMFGVASVVGSLLWIVYVALEPYVRRNWPTLLVAWTRLLAGRYRDPLVGRDVLVGVCVGLVVLQESALLQALPGWVGLAPNVLPLSPALHGAGAVISNLLGNVASSTFISSAFLFLVFLGRLVLRKQMLAVAILALLLVGPSVMSSEYPWLTLPSSFFGNAVMLLAITRGGLVTGVSASVAFSCVAGFPDPFPLGAWYSPAALAGPATLLALAAFAFYASLGGRPALGRLSLD